MPEKLNDTSEKRILEKWIITSLCLIAGWLLIGYFIPQLLFFYAILFFIMIICGMYLELPDKYLIPSIYIMAAIYGLIVLFIIRDKKNEWDEILLLANFFVFIFISYFLFSIRIIQQEKNKNKKARRRVIIDKLLILTFALIFNAIFHYIVIHTNQ